MILYLDTSALVKLFVEEAYSAPVRQAVSAAQLVVTHSIAYVEACATFARVAHARGDEALFPALRRNLDIQWKAWEIVDATESLIHVAADVAGKHLGGGEHDHAEEEQRDERERKPLEQKPGDRVPPPRKRRAAAL